MMALAAHALGVLLVAQPDAAVAATGANDDGPSIQVGGLVQPQLRVTSDESPSHGLSNDLFLRRVRVVVSGQLTRRVRFFVNVEQVDLGSRDVQFDPQFAPLGVNDAALSFDVHDAITIDAGLLMTPFTRQSMQSAATLHTLDYHARLVLMPNGSGLRWRDGGVQARVRLLDGRLTVRAGVFQGVKSQRREVSTHGSVGLNPDDVPRAAAHVRWNLLGREDELFLSGIHFDGQPHLSFGVGANVQPDAVSFGTQVNDFKAFAADGFVDWPVLGDGAIVGQAAAMLYQQGAQNPATGLAWFAELGARWRWLEPVASLENFFHTNESGTRDDRERSLNFFAGRLGLNLWLRQHALNVKAEAAVLRFHDQTVSNPQELKQATTFVVQTQMLF